VVFNGPADICITDGIQTNLNGGSPSGGVYSGPGITDGADGMNYSFDPATAGTGMHTITYTLPCGSSMTDMVEVFALPVVTLEDPGDFCIDSGNIKNLAGGSPTCGPPPFAAIPTCMYSGPGVTDNGNGTYDFNTMDAGVGVHTITYTHSDVNGCSGGASIMIEVFALPTVTFTAPADLCIDAGV